MKSFWIKKGLKFVAFAALFILAVGGIVMTLWNWLIPVLFSGPIISFGQALGLLLLSKILFGGMGRGPGWGGGWRGGQWRHKMEERWKNATPEEREQWKQRWGRKFNHPGTSQF